MGWPKCNTTEEDMMITEDPLWDGHTFHTIGLWVGAIFTLIALLISFFLILMHATRYLKPWEQKHIIRILFMIPIYAAVSLLSFYYYRHSVYFEVIRDCYEAFAIASFFSLMCAYLAPDLHQQKIYFRTIKPKKWVWPMGYLQKITGGAEKGWLRNPRSGLTWFNYCFIRVFFTIVSVITQALDLYCLESLSPAFSHIWVMVFETVSITVAMYCLIQFYVQIKDDIRQHKPLLKITAIKLVIFLSFWQTIAISFLTSAGAIKANNTVQTPDIKVGIPALLLCIEMAFFAVFHIWSFSWKPYTIGSKEQMSEVVAGEGIATGSYQGGFLGLKALADSFNGWDMLKATGRSARWLFKGRKSRHTDSSYTLNRKDTDGSDFSAQGQTLNTFSSQPTYSGGGTKLPPYNRFGDEEDANLLANSQSMPTSQPPAFQTPGQYDSNNASDIGLATSSYDDKYNGRYDPPDGRPPPPQSYPSYQSSIGGQESGTVSIPYPDSRPGTQAHSHLGGQDSDRIYMARREVRMPV
ncbi:transmembrane protein [Cladophialophora carrionii]|uniref:Transmembrane protein n=1 Tax=Cladophialophora carrionii TaxID=86049 RepID=A0A1C1CPE7_9EURO|nr:transmembrane protein [Cladophialophora carrionii]